LVNAKEKAENENMKKKSKIEKRTWLDCESEEAMKVKKVREKR